MNFLNNEILMLFLTGFVFLFVLAIAVVNYDLKNKRIKKSLSTRGALIQNLKVMFSFKCPYRFDCDFAQESSATCNGEVDWKGKGFNYCGRFREFEKEYKKEL